jgi:mRNA-degrading endonuclease toxin of MazEF toxin-antitoxin module
MVATVMSNDVANEYGQTVTVVPTQKYTAPRADRAYLVDLRRPRSNLQETRVANASMITTYDRRRVVARAGRLVPDTVQALEVAVAVHLGMHEP